VYTVQDGLGSVRAEIAANTDITAMGAYEPYGVPMNVEGIYSQPFRFTGEMLDSNALQYHRARYYDAGAAQWASLDPWEGLAGRPMSLNGYSWVEGNTVMNTDPTGRQVPCPARGIEPGSGNFDAGRWGQCEILFDILKSGGTPTWTQVYSCYPCVLDMSLYPTIQAYSEALEQALIDEYATRQAIERAINSFNGYVTPTIPENIFYGDTGYLEGISVGGIISIIGPIGIGGQTGREIVYNFSTFQRSTFSYNGSGGGVPAGGVNAYFGGVEGFVEEFPSKFEGGAFFGQYSGDFTVRPTGIGIPMVTTQP